MGTVYIGVTDNLKNRVIEHKSGFFRYSFTKKYKLDKLVYYECHDDIHRAMTRERQMKKWNRNWKLKLIIDKNPQWDDLFYDLGGEF